MSKGRAIESEKPKPVVVFPRVPVKKEIIEVVSGDLEEVVPASPVLSSPSQKRPDLNKPILKGTELSSQLMRNLAPPPTPPKTFETTSIEERQKSQDSTALPRVPLCVLPRRLRQWTNTKGDKPVETLNAKPGASGDESKPQVIEPSMIKLKVDYDPLEEAPEAPAPGVVDVGAASVPKGLVSEELTIKPPPWIKGLVHRNSWGKLSNCLSFTASLDKSCSVRCSKAVPKGRLS